MAAVVAVLFLAAATLTLPSSSAQEAGVLVLFDFGDGSYEWVRVMANPENRTAILATETASQSLGLPPVEITWYDEDWCVRRPCAGVDDIGDRNPAGAAWWHFYIWNTTVPGWEMSPLGPSDTDVIAGAIAWYLAVDDPNTYASPLPVPTPDFPRVWTSFRGDLRNRGAAQGEIPGTNTVLWERDVGVLEIDTTPVVAYGRVFVGTRNGLFALDAESGRQVWRNPTVRTLLSTPAVYDGKLIVGGTDGRLHAVDVARGDLLWSIVLETGALSTGIASSPAIHEGRAYVGIFNEDPGGMGAVVAVNLNNWSIAWRYETASVHMSQPAIADGFLYVGLMGVYNGGIGYLPPHGLLALHLNGTLGWFRSTDGEVASSPVVAGGRVFVTSKDGNLYAFDAGGEVWRRAISPSTSSPALVGDRLYVGSGALDGTGRLHAFALNGTQIWEATVGGAIQASVVSDGSLVCAATNVPRGQHVCVDAGEGHLVWSHTPEPTQYILGSPVVVGNTMYVVSDNGHVYAFRPAHPTGATGPDVVVTSVALFAVLFVVIVSIALYRWRRGRPRA